jgi:hypothetical protein
MFTDPDRIPRALERIAEELRQQPSAGDWVDAFAERDAIGTDEAGFIADCSAQTIRRRASEATASGKPIGIWFAQSVWVISKRRLLDDIEARDGLPGRLAAISRADKYVALNPRDQVSMRDGLAATG